MLLRIDHFLNSKSYLLVVFSESLVVVVLNWNATAMDGILPYYLKYRDLIHAGLEAEQIKRVGQTFPMWGYGWLMALTTDKSVLLIVQAVISTLSLAVFISEFDRGQWFDRRTLNVFRLLVIGSLSWFAFHAVLWPYSIAVSCFLASFAFFLRALRLTSWRPCAVSAILFGLMLNFRSDFILLPAGMFFAAVIFMPRLSTVVLLTIWVVLVYSTLIPWGIYTTLATGEFNFRSTNAGHVLFIGLGQLPANKWQIEPHDNDPKMREIVRERTGSSDTLSSTADSLLRREFILRVIEDPGEYFQKCIFVAKSLLWSGFYQGEFLKDGLRELMNEHGVSRIRELFGLPLGWWLSNWRTVLQIYSIVSGEILFFVSILCIPILLVWAWVMNNVAVWLMESAIVYQVSVNVLAFHMALYSTNLLLFHLMAIAVMMGLIVTSLTGSRDCESAGR